MIMISVDVYHSQIKESGFPVWNRANNDINSIRKMHFFNI